MAATGNSSIADSLVLVNKTSALGKITINDVLDTQNNVSGNGVADSATGLSTLKNLVGSGTTTVQALNSLYGRVANDVTISNTPLTVDNAIPVSTFTVGSTNKNISYTITDSAGHSTGALGDFGLATTTSNATEVDVAIAGASSVTASGTLTVAQAVEMLEDASGTALTSASGFTYHISDSYTNLNNASTASGIDKVAYDGAASRTLSKASVADLIDFRTNLANSASSYTVKDTLDNLSATSITSAANVTFDAAAITGLLGKSAAIEIVDAPGDSGSAYTIDGDNAALRTKVNTVVSRAVDTGDNNAAVPITATIHGTHASLVAGTPALTTSDTRTDQITLGVKTTDHTVAQINLLKAKTGISTLTLVGGVGIGDILDNLINTTDHSSKITAFDNALTATVAAPIALTGLGSVGSLTLRDDNDIAALNALAGHAEAPITATITDTSGTYLLAGGAATQLDLTGSGSSSDDDITLKFTSFTVGGNNVAEIEDLIQAPGVSSIASSASNQTVTLNAAQAKQIGDLSDSSNKLALNFTLSNAATFLQAAALVGNTSGSVVLHSNGINDDIANFVNADPASSAATDISTNYKTVRAADDDANLTITGFTTPAVTSHEMNALNLIAAKTKGIITASFTTSASNADLLDKTNWTTNNSTIGSDVLSITVSDGLLVRIFEDLDELTNQSIVLTTGITDSLSALYSGSDLTAGIKAAVDDDSDITIEINDTNITSGDFAKVNALANTASYTNGFAGGITANIKGNIADLKGTTLNQLSHLTDDISFTVDDDPDVSEIATLALRTSNGNITVSGTITDTLYDFIDSADNSTAKTDWATTLITSKCKRKCFSWNIITIKLLL